MIPFLLLEAEEFFAVGFIGGLGFLGEGELLLVFFAGLVEFVFLGPFLLEPLFGGSFVLLGLFEIGEFLLLFFDYIYLSCCLKLTYLTCVSLPRPAPFLASVPLTGVHFLDCCKESFWMEITK